MNKYIGLFLCLAIVISCADSSQLSSFDYKDLKKAPVLSLEDVFEPIISFVSGDANVKISTRYKRHKLSKNGFSCIHRRTNRLVSPKLRFKSCTWKYPCN